MEEETPLFRRGMVDIIREVDPTYGLDFLAPLEDGDTVIQQQLPLLGQKYWTMLITLNKMLFVLYTKLVNAFNDSRSVKKGSIESLAIFLAVSKIIGEANISLYSFRIVYREFTKILKTHIPLVTPSNHYDVREGFTLVETASEGSLIAYRRVSELLKKEGIITGASTETP